MRTIAVAVALLGLGVLAVPLGAQRTEVDTFTVVQVQNERAVPVTVYLDFGTFARRIGVVAPRSSATIPLTSRLLQGHPTVRLFTHAAGADEDLASQTFELRRGMQIAMRVPAAAVGEPAQRDTMMEALPPHAPSVSTVTIDNPRDVPVTVYIENGPFDVRLGRVAARSRATLRFPKALVGPGQTIQLFVHPEGGRDLATETLRVGKGEHLGIRVPPR